MGGEQGMGTKKSNGIETEHSSTNSSNILSHVHSIRHCLCWRHGITLTESVRAPIPACSGRGRLLRVHDPNRWRSQP